MQTRKFQGAGEVANFEADLICDATEVARAYEHMAQGIGAAVGDRFPILMPVMIGGIIALGEVVSRLDFPHEIDYLHATRYRGGTRGDEIEWRVFPERERIEGRQIVVIDDILDEGETLAAIKARLLRAGAAGVHLAVLCDKQLGRPRILERADIRGVEIPNRYVFGCGMDYKGLYRQLPEIYAVQGL